MLDRQTGLHATVNSDYTQRPLVQLCNLHAPVFLCSWHPLMQLLTSMHLSSYDLCVLWPQG